MTRRQFLTIPAASTLIPATTNDVGVSATGAVQRINWPNLEAKVSLGSLLKPFIALAFLSANEQIPVVYCRGKVDGCWYEKGHGTQEITAALSNSCNVYFLKLAGRISPSTLELVSLRYGLAVPYRDWNAERIIGKGEGWPQSPLAVARAFAQVAGSRQDGRVALVLQGMELCALRGTARAVGIRCYAKTGTAACVHGHGGSGDGYAVAIFPVDEPRRIVLVSRHNSTGANVAASAGSLLRST